MAGHPSFINFGDGNQGFQIGQNNATIQATIHLPPVREPTPPPSARIPFRRDSKFVNRGNIFDYIDREFSQPAGRVALTGLGGVGKSQLAIEFAYRFSDRIVEAWVFWVHAGTLARVVEGFKLIAKRVNLPVSNKTVPEMLQLVNEWLAEERHGRWLMILDGADDPNVFLSSIEGGENNELALIEYLPESPNGSILTTTRNRNLAYRLTGIWEAIHDLGPMNENEALELLGNQLGTESDPILARKFVEMLDLFPLAISQAAVFIRMRAPLVSLESYAEQFRKSEEERARLLNHDSGDRRRQFFNGEVSNAILTTWQLSFNHIQNNRKSAANLLSLMSFFDCQGIPDWMLDPSKRLGHGGRPLDPEDVSLLGGQVREEFNSSGVEFGGTLNYTDCHGSKDKIHNEFEEDIKTLRDYCLVTTRVQDNNTYTFEMHKLVQLAMRRWLDAQQLHGAFLFKYIGSLLHAFPDPSDESQIRHQALLLHVETALDYQPEWDVLKNASSILFNSAGSSLFSQGRYLTAERMFSRAIQLQWASTEKDATTLCDSIGNLAHLLANQCRQEEAFKLQTDLMEIRCQMMNSGQGFSKSDLPSVLENLNSLAVMLTGQGRLEEAELLQLDVLEMRKEFLGEDHESTLVSMTNLAAIYERQCRLPEAEDLGRHVLDSMKEMLGEDNLYTLAAKELLAQIYYHRGQLEEAGDLVRMVLDTAKVKHGESHPSTLRYMHNLSILWYHEGRYDEAVSLLEDCVRMKSESFGHNHAYTRISSEALDNIRNN